MRRHWILPLIVSSLAIWGIGCSGSTSKTDEAAARVPVEVVSVALGEIEQSITYNGDVRAELEVKVFSKIPDRIEKYYVDEGNYVRQGAPVARIFAATIEQGVRQAEAGLAAARAQEANVAVEYERAQKLFKENVMSKQQFDMVQMQHEAAKAALEQAQAGVISARSTLNDATVTAPIPGIIGKRYYEAGDMANPAMPLVTVVQMERVKVAFDATENDLGRLKVGQEAIVHVKSFENESFQGRIHKISPVLDPMSRMASVEVLVNNPDRRLKPGMFARVKVVTGKLRDVIAVPRHATIEKNIIQNVNNQEQVSSQYLVYVVKDDRAQQRKLDVSYVNHVQLAVRAGLELGEQLVVSGQAGLREGTAVKIIDKAEAAL